jgi:hypothetical protein
MKLSLGQRYLRALRYTGDFEKHIFLMLAVQVRPFSYLSYVLLCWASWIDLGEVEAMWGKHEGKKKKGKERKKHTTPGIRWSSPTQLLIWPLLT